VLNASPDGQNINRGVGAMHPEGLQKEVLRSGAQLGLAFDGDGDRLISVDEAGQIRDGDYALAICGRHLAARGQLKGGTVVTTVMANLALDRTLTKAGIGLAKVAVGDRYVLEEMLRIGANLGGEQSGHLLFLDHATTGDGIVSALQLIGVMRESGASLGELAQCLVKFPQVLVNVRVKSKPAVGSIPDLAERVQVVDVVVERIVGRVAKAAASTAAVIDVDELRHVAKGRRGGLETGVVPARPAVQEKQHRPLDHPVPVRDQPRAVHIEINLRTADLGAHGRFHDGKRPKEPPVCTPS
jgi:phosphoglucosamine mutase